ncbi:hypothetical protein RF11_03834 [Thelohanellus kitauei]|uniref:Uncharacterized protein n=1 Tax=Thelohanellus kitauei TaxID=669202 RepID=A0A0C2MXL7_THEKT|nr:hypothetical protein RF11_03834 [Thelohanellus kitauei]
MTEETVNADFTSTDLIYPCVTDGLKPLKENDPIIWEKAKIDSRENRLCKEQNQTNIIFENDHFIMHEDVMAATTEIVILLAAGTATKTDYTPAPLHDQL